MKVLLFVIPAAALFACTPDKQTCVDTGCSAGTTCNTVSGQCELSSFTGGGDGSTGGGSATGGSGGGGGTNTIDAGGGMEDVDAGSVIDPFDDGGTFFPGDICTWAIPIDFDGTLATVNADLTQAEDQYTASCGNSSGSSGNDLIFAVTLTEPHGLRVRASDTSGNNQDPMVSVLASPCAAFNTVACADDEGGGEAEEVSVDRLGAGTWYVLLDNYSTSASPGSYTVDFELTPPPVAPDNDLCSAGTQLMFTNDVATVMGTTIGAGNENANEPLSCSSGTASRPEVFYRFTLAQPQDVLVEAQSTEMTPVVALLTACTGGNEVGCASGSPSSLRRSSLPAGDYIVVVDSGSSARGAFSLNVTLSAPTPPPANDLCTGAATLVPNVTQTVNLNDASYDYELSCRSPTSDAGGDVIYTFTTTMNQRIKVTADETSTDVVLSLRTACDDLASELDCKDYSSATDAVDVDVLNAPPGTYFVVVAAWDTDDVPGTTGVSLELLPPVLPPDNDSCAMPETLASGATVMVNANAANADFDFSACDTFEAERDVVYTFTLTAPSTVLLEATGDIDTNVMLELRSGAMCDTSTTVACADTGYWGDEERISRNVLPAGVYYVLLGAVDEAVLGLSLTVSPAPPPPSNDTCMTAATLVPDMTVNVDASGASVDVSDPTCLDDPSVAPALHDVVYTFTTMSTQRVVLAATSGGDTNVVLSLRSGSCATGMEEACRDDGYIGEDERIAIQALPAGQYWVVVTTDTDDADIGLSLTLTAPPTVPTNDSCTAPEVVTLTGGTATRLVDLGQATTADFDGVIGCASGADGLDVVYSVSIPAGQTLTVTSQTDADGDVVLASRSPMCALEADNISCVDEYGGGGSEELIVPNTGTSAITAFIIVKEYSSGFEDVVTVTFTAQ